MSCLVQPELPKTWSFVTDEFYSSVFVDKIFSHEYINKSNQLHLKSVFCPKYLTDNMKMDFIVLKKKWQPEVLFLLNRRNRELYYYTIWVAQNIWVHMKKCIGFCEKSLKVFPKQISEFYPNEKVPRVWGSQYLLTWEPFRIDNKLCICLTYAFTEEKTRLN